MNKLEKALVNLDELIKAQEEGLKYLKKVREALEDTSDEDLSDLFN